MYIIIAWCRGALQEVYVLNCLTFLKTQLTVCYIICLCNWYYETCVYCCSLVLLCTCGWVLVCVCLLSEVSFGCSASGCSHTRPYHRPDGEGHCKSEQVPNLSPRWSWQTSLNGLSTCARQVDLIPTIRQTNPPFLRHFSRHHKGFYSESKILLLLCTCTLYLYTVCVIALYTVRTGI